MSEEEIEEKIEQAKREAYAKGWSDALESVKRYCYEQDQR